MACCRFCGQVGKLARLLFKVEWAEIANGRMASNRVVEPFIVIKQICLFCIARPAGLLPFGLELREEINRRRIACRPRVSGTSIPHQPHRLKLELVAELRSLHGKLRFR
jgi:hypothetical protein